MDAWEYRVLRYVWNPDFAMKKWIIRREIQVKTQIIHTSHACAPNLGDFSFLSHDSLRKWKLYFNHYIFFPPIFSAQFFSEFKQYKKNTEYKNLPHDHYRRCSRRRLYAKQRQSSKQIQLEPRQPNCPISHKPNYAMTNISTTITIYVIKCVYI